MHCFGNNVRNLGAGISQNRLPSAVRNRQRPATPYNDYLSKYLPVLLKQQENFYIYPKPFHNTYKTNEIALTRKFVQNAIRTYAAGELHNFTQDSSESSTKFFPHTLRDTH